MAVDSANEALLKDEKSASSPAAGGTGAGGGPKSGKNREEIRQVARKFADQPVQNSDVGAWGILTAISKLARKRPQGMNIILTDDQHCFGRCVEDSCYRIESLAISAKHCTIFREKATSDGELDSNVSAPAFIKDTSTNGTFVNGTKLEHSVKVKLQHGDIISFTQPAHAASAYAFVYREVNKSSGLTNGTNGSVPKRKSEDFVGERKRLKGIGIGAPEGPISLDDVRSLQRSNTELRQQLESHVHTIETMRSENRATIARYDSELKEMQEKVSSSYVEQIKELHLALDSKQKENDEQSTTLAGLRHSIDDLNERLRLSNQSRADSDEIIHSQKTAISELETQLREERNLRRGEREKAEVDLKSALQKAHLEAQEEINRQADVYLKQQKEQQEVISKLQESEKESRLLVETLRSKLEDIRGSLSMSEKKVRQLEVQVQDEQAASAISKKRSETLDTEVRKLAKERDSEKVAREEAWAKVSSLELEISAAIRDLSIEKQRFQGARERIILRETQLRAFYSTTEEISALFTKQQEQLKAMQKTLEDEENYANTLLGVDLNEPVMAAVNATYHRVRDETQPENNTKEASGASTPMHTNATRESSDDASTTEKHDCGFGNQDGNTQDIECTSSDRLAKEIVSDVDGIGTAVVPYEDPGGDPNDTERVLGTETQSVDVVFDEREAALRKCSNLAGDMMQLNDEMQIQEPLGPNSVEPKEDVAAGCSQSRMEEDTPTCAITTGDLLASEVFGSLAVSTAPSMNGENESPRSQGDPIECGQKAATSTSNEDIAAAALIQFSDGQASGSESTAPCFTKLTKEHRAVNDMVGIIAPEFKQPLLSTDDRGRRNESMSDAETDKGSNNSGDETESDSGGDDNEIVIEDSLG